MELSMKHLATEARNKNVSERSIGWLLCDKFRNTIFKAIRFESSLARCARQNITDGR